MGASLPVSEPITAIVVMGVAGCGKSTIADGLAQALGGTYVDGDALHPPENIAKMSAGTPLADADRWPWLAAVGQRLGAFDGIGVIACSALKRSYRNLISRQAGRPVCFVYLDGSRALIAARMGARTGHFMPTALLDSQFADLEVPGADELAVHVSIDAEPDAVVAAAVSALAALEKSG